VIGDWVTSARCEGGPLDGQRMDAPPGHVFLLGQWCRFRDMRSYPIGSADYVFDRNEGSTAVFVPADPSTPKEPPA